MKILYLTLNDMQDINARGIYTDLLRELSKGDNVEVYVISALQKRMKMNTYLENVDNISILHVKVGNITANKSMIEKGISTLTIEKLYLRAIKKYFPNIVFDMVLYSTPPITFSKIVKYFKHRHGSFTYLMLKDIFPQNAVDISMIKKGGCVHRYFRLKEKKLYKQSDMIGCMSKGNINYLLDHNKFVDPKRVEILHNSIEPREFQETGDTNIRSMYGIPQDKTLFIYGGNLGRPQGLDFLTQIFNSFEELDNSYLLIVGSGSEYHKIDSELKIKKYQNIKLMSKLPKEDYDNLIQQADVGLIFLDRRFTIPNIPSRITSYMESKIPIIAATDPNTDLKNIIWESGCGYWCESGDVSKFMTYVNELSSDDINRKQMGLNGRKFLETNYNVKESAIKIISKIKNKQERGYL